MYILIEKFNNNEKILNILQRNSEKDIKKYIIETLISEIESRVFTPLYKNVYDINFKINEEGNGYTLVKKYKLQRSGYIYNSYSKHEETILSIRYLKYF